MRNFDESLVWLGFFAAVFLAWYFYLKARNKERMALIESGKDVSEIYKKQEIKLRFPWLKLALMVIGIGFGLGVFFFIYAFSAESFQEMKRDLPEMLLASSMMFFGGLGLIIGYYLEKPKK
jgi:MFS family permease